MTDATAALLIGLWLGGAGALCVNAYVGTRMSGVRPTVAEIIEGTVLLLVAWVFILAADLLDVLRDDGGDGG